MFSVTHDEAKGKENGVRTREHMENNQPEQQLQLHRRRMDSNKDGESVEEEPDGVDADGDAKECRSLMN